MTALNARLEEIYAQMQGELSVLQVERKIKTRVKSQMERTQREYYLNEQMKAIQKELGDGEDGQNELAELEAKIAATKFSKEAREKAEAELKKLKSMSPMSAEATVVRNYLDWMLSIPWGVKSKVKKDLGRAQQVLDADHYSLDKVKERIVEYLAVQSRSAKLKGPIMCLVGPPGVGKNQPWALCGPRKQGANLSASAWAASVTNPRFVAIGAPISGPCRARSSKR